MDTPRVHRHDHDDDTVEAHYSSLERMRPHACIEGVVYVGHLVDGDDGEEAEVIEAVPCRRCTDSRYTAPISHAAIKTTRVGVIGRMMALLE